MVIISISIFPFPFRNFSNYYKLKYLFLFSENCEHEIKIEERAIITTTKILLLLFYRYLLFYLSMRNMYDIYYTDATISIISFCFFVKYKE